MKRSTWGDTGNGSNGARARGQRGSSRRTVRRQRQRSSNRRTYDKLPLRTGQSPKSSGSGTHAPLTVAADVRGRALQSLLRNRSARRLHSNRYCYCSWIALGLRSDSALYPHSNPGALPNPRPGSPIIMETMKVVIVVNGRQVSEVYRRSPLYPTNHPSQDDYEDYNIYELELRSETD